MVRSIRTVTMEGPNDFLNTVVFTESEAFKAVERLF